MYIHSTNISIFDWQLQKYHSERKDNSIDCSTEDRAPNRCLPFDGIGARHPGIVALSGHTPAANGSLVPAPGVIWDAEPQYHQKVNNDLGLYPLWNGLSN